MPLETQRHASGFNDSNSVEKNRRGRPIKTIFVWNSSKFGLVWVLVYVKLYN